MEYVSLFTGIGGIDLGFDRAGMECRVQVEKDKYCNQILRRHWPDVRRYEDVRGVGREEVGAAEVVCGGFPCQGLSVAGRRAGLDDPRSGLWFEFGRIVEEARPAWVVIENVPGLLSSGKGSDFAVILRSLDEWGYGVAWRRLDSQYDGLAQRRKRIFIVGHLGDTRAGEVLFEQESLSWDTAPRREKGEEFAKDVAGSIDGGGAGRSYPGTTLQGVTQGHAFPAYALNSRNNRLDAESQTLVPFKLDNTKSNGRAWSEKETAFTLCGTTNAVAWKIRGGKEGGGNGYLGNDERAFTVSETQDQYVGVRRLTPLECERLQGFPDDWTEWGLDDSSKRAEISDTQRYRMLGNAVSVPVAFWIAKRIMAVA